MRPLLALISLALLAAPAAAAEKCATFRAGETRVLSWQSDKFVATARVKLLSDEGGVARFAWTLALQNLTARRLWVQPAIKLRDCDNFPVAASEPRWIWAEVGGDTDADGHLTVQGNRGAEVGNYYIDILTSDRAQ